MCEIKDNIEQLKDELDGQQTEEDYDFLTKEIADLEDVYTCNKCGMQDCPDFQPDTFCVPDK